MEARYKNLITRAITGAVFVLVLVGGILTNQWTFQLLFLLITFLGLKEFYELLNKGRRKVMTVPNVLAGTGIYILISLSALKIIDDRFVFLSLPLILFPFVAELYRKDEKPYENISLSILGMLYIALPFALLNLIANPQSFYPYHVLGFIILIWVHDTGSYIAGFTLGRTLLFERISPKKTWEGSAGGFVFTLIAAFILQNYIPLPHVLDWIIIGILIIVFGTFGDLVESLLKRNLGVKDSGTILPGHGGILDRFDSLVYATPFIFTYLKIRGIL